VKIEKPKKLGLWILLAIVIALFARETGKLFGSGRFPF
jgi:hypothetical protein